MHAKYRATPDALSDREDTDTPDCSRMGVLLVSPTFNHFAVITPGPDALPFATEGLSVATDGTVTLAPADEPGATPFAVTLKAGEIHDIGAAKVTASAAGAVIGWWRRKPAAP